MHLKQGLNALNIDHSTAQREQLEAYLALLIKWNKTYNLTAIRDPKTMVTHHLLDSAALLPWVQGNTLLDVGSGAGLPGIVLAILDPKLQVTCCECNTKRICFLKQVVANLQLPNVTIAHLRIEDLPTEQRFDTITSRAFTDLARFYALTHSHVKIGGQILAMKGQPTPEELTHLDAEHECIPLEVPGVDAERCVVRIPM